MAVRDLGAAGHLALAVAHQDTFKPWDIDTFDVLRDRLLLPQNASSGSTYDPTVSTPCDSGVSIGKAVHQFCFETSAIHQKIGFCVNMDYALQCWAQILPTLQTCFRIELEQ